MLSLDLCKEKELDQKLEEYILQKIEERTKAKEAKNYELADAIRTELESQGIWIKDTKDGTIYERR